MSSCIESGAPVRCQFGTNPSRLAVSGPYRLASVNDYRPFENIRPFGACVCPNNPQVAAASTAAGGALVPQPCVPAVDLPWLTASPAVLGGVPGLGLHSTARCRWGGLLTLVPPDRSREHG